jgi:hypothetical protein
MDWILANLPSSFDRTLGMKLPRIWRELSLAHSTAQAEHHVSKSVGMSLAAAEFGVDLGLEEEDSQGFGITPT